MANYFYMTIYMAIVKKKKYSCVQWEKLFVF